MSSLSINSVNVTMSPEDLENFRKWQVGQAAEVPSNGKLVAKQTVKDYLGPQLTIKHTTRNFRDIAADLKKCGIPVLKLKSVRDFGSITLMIDYKNATEDEVKVLKAILEASLKRETIKFDSGKTGEYYQPRILHGQECYARKFLGIEEPSEPSPNGKSASEPSPKGKPASKPTNKGKPASEPSPKGKPASKPTNKNRRCEDQRLYLTIEGQELEDQAKRLQGEHPGIFSGYQFTKKGDKIKMLLREDVDPSKLKSFLDDGNTSLIPKEKKGQINAILSKAEPEEEPDDESDDESDDEIQPAERKNWDESSDEEEE